MKVKFALEQPLRPRRDVQVQIYSFFNLGTRWGGWLRPRPGTHCIGGWVGAENFALTGNFFLSLYVKRTSCFLIVVAFFFLPFVLTVQHTQQTDVHAPGGIRTRNPSKRSTADPCLRPLGHGIRSPNRPVRGQSLNRLLYPGPHDMKHPVE